MNKCFDESRAILTDLRPSQQLASSLVSLFCICLALALVAGCDRVVNSAPSLAQQPAGKANILTVNVARAELSENVSETASSFGTIKPRRSSSLGFARAGRVSNVFVQVGDLVSEGDKIAELDQGEMVNQQEELDSVLSSLNQDLTLLESGGNAQEQRRKEQEIAELTNQQQKLTREFQKGFIVAPYRGVIAERNAEAGDAVPAGRPFFRILEAEQPIVELHVPVKLAELVTVGDEVWVKHRQEIVYANVATKAPELDPSARTVSLTLTLAQDNDKQKYNYGEVVEVQFLNETDRDGYWLPYSALQSEGNGRWSTFVLEGDGEQRTIRRKIVNLLLLDDTHALVEGSLDTGDLFIMDGLNRVVPGQIVQGKLVPNIYPPARIAEAGE